MCVCASGMCVITPGPARGVCAFQLGYGAFAPRLYAHSEKCGAGLKSHTEEVEYGIWMDRHEDDQAIYYPKSLITHSFSNGYRRYQT